MPSTRDLRRRIVSIRGTAQITRAMQMVASSKMRKAQQAAISARAFAKLLYQIQRKVTTRAVTFRDPLQEVREVRKRAVILVAADKGLCGALNSNVFRLANDYDPHTTLFITAGRKAAQFVAVTRKQLVAEFAYGDEHQRMSVRAKPGSDYQLVPATLAEPLRVPRSVERQGQRAERAHGLDEERDRGR
jgi:F-type H+-transporting ATPase subunit gamma